MSLSPTKTRFLNNISQSVDDEYTGIGDDLKATENNSETSQIQINSLQVDQAWLEADQFYLQSQITSLQTDVQAAALTPKRRYIIQAGCDNVGGSFPNVVYYGNSNIKADPVIPFSGKIISISISGSAVITFGGVFVYPRIGGVTDQTEYAFIGLPTDTQYSYHVFTTNLPFNAGARVGIDAISFFNQPLTVDLTLIMVIEET